MIMRMIVNGLSQKEHDNTALGSYRARDRSMYVIDLVENCQLVVCVRVCVCVCVCLCVCVCV